MLTDEGPCKNQKIKISSKMGDVIMLPCQRPALSCLEGDVY